MRRFLIYGANCYTGRLIAREAAVRGLPAVLAGRNAEAVGEAAQQYKMEGRLFSLDDPAAVDAGLEGVAAVLNCAGPFADTFRPLVETCLKTSTHYLDITGEIRSGDIAALVDLRDQSLPALTANRSWCSASAEWPFCSGKRSSNFSRPGNRQFRPRKVWKYWRSWRQPTEARNAAARRSPRSSGRCSIRCL